MLSYVLPYKCRGRKEYKYELHTGNSRHPELYRMKSESGTIGR